MSSHYYKKYPCQNCGMRIDSGTKKCPLCGATNTHYESLKSQEKEERRVNARRDRERLHRIRNARFVKCDLCGKVYDRNFKCCPDCQTTNAFYPRHKKIGFWIKGFFLICAVLILSILIYTSKNEKDLTDKAKEMPLKAFRAQCQTYDYTNDFCRKAKLMKGRYVKLENLTLKDGNGYFIGTGKNKSHKYELMDARKNTDISLLDGDEVIIYGVFDMISSSYEKPVPVVYIIDVDFLNDTK